MSSDSDKYFAQMLNETVVTGLDRAHNSLAMAGGQLHYHLFGDGRKLYSGEDFIPPHLRSDAMRLWKLVEEAMVKRGEASRLAYEISRKTSPSPNRRGPRKRTSRNPKRTSRKPKRTSRRAR